MTVFYCTSQNQNHKKITPFVKKIPTGAKAQAAEEIFFFAFLLVLAALISAVFSEAHNPSLVCSCLRTISQRSGLLEIFSYIFFSRFGQNIRQHTDCKPK